MRRALSFASILSIVLIASVYSAFSANLNATRMKVDISFPFYVGAEQHPAGEYWIETRDWNYSSATGSALVIRSQDGSVFHFLPTRSIAFNEKQSVAHLIFNHIGDRYFLSQVHQSGWHATMYQDRSEKQLARTLAKGSQEVPTTVVAYAVAAGR
jgi:hypothetical protein